MRLNTPSDLSEVFKIDQSSVSNLSWNIDINCGPHMALKKCWVGKPCTYFNITTKRYYVEYRNKSYSVSRVVYCISNYKNYTDKTFVVDHIDGNPVNNSVDNLRAVSCAINSRNTAKRISTEFTGVSFQTPVPGFSYWRARWTDEGGKQRSVQFSVTKLGYEVAKEAAIQFRKNKLKELNEKGAGYTERHGT